MNRRPGPSGLPERQRFWQGVDSSGGPDACHPWVGGRNRKRAGRGHGYGVLRIKRDGKWRVIKAHRYAMALHLKIDIADLPAWAQVHHECENHLCCNGQHLMLIDSHTHDRIHASDLKRRIK